MFNVLHTIARRIIRNTSASTNDPAHERGGPGQPVPGDAAVAAPPTRAPRTARAQQSTRSGAAAHPRERGRLVVDDSPRQLLPYLAEALHSTPQALVLQQIHYRLRQSTNRHDGRYWVYNTDDQWLEQLPNLKKSTFRRAVTGLKERGLLLTGHYARRTGNQTTWYTIDYVALDAFWERERAAASRRAAPPLAERPNPPGGAGGPRDSHPDRRPGDADQMGRSSRPSRVVKTTTSQHETPDQITTQTTQQQPAGHPDEQGGDVVVTPPALIDQLIGRGVTGTVARRLVAAHPAALVARQIAIFDHLRELQPDDNRLSGGRLRRQIEEDWAPPPTWEAPEILAARAAAVEVERAARAVRAAEREAEARERDAAAARRFALLGTTSEQQSTLRLLINTPSPLERGTPSGMSGRLSALGDAFRAVMIGVSDGATVAIVAVPDQGALDSIMTPANQRHRDLLKRRLQGRYPWCTDINYLTDTELGKLLHAPEPTVADVSDPEPAEPAVVEEARLGGRGRPSLRLLP